MKLEIESENGYILGLIARTFEIFSRCKGYPNGKGCHDCKDGYAKNPGNLGLGCKIIDIEEAIIVANL